MVFFNTEIKNLNKIIDFFNLDIFSPNFQIPTEMKIFPASSSLVGPKFSSSATSAKKSTAGGHFTTSTGTKRSPKKNFWSVSINCKTISMTITR